MHGILNKFMGRIYEPETMVPHAALASFPNKESDSLRKKREEAIAYLRARSLYVLDRDSPPPKKTASILGQHRDRVEKDSQ